MIPEDLELETPVVRMKPMLETDMKIFHELAQDNDTWQFFTLNLADELQLRQWMNLAFKEKAANLRRPFTIIDKSTGAVAGSMSMGNISIHDLRLEIGWSWLGAAYRGSLVNFHSKFAMMQYAFEVLEFERVEFKTDVLNLRARRGLEKIGGIEEGILRSHMTMWNNRRRSSVYYSILKDEWPAVRTTIFKDIP